MIPNLRLGATPAAIELPTKNDPAANARTHRDVNQSALAAPRSPRRLAQRRCVALVLQRHAHVERALQILYGVATLPRGQKTHVAEFSSDGIHPTGRPASDAGNSPASLARPSARPGR